MKFPITLKLTGRLETDIAAVRAAVVFMTAYSRLKGLGGHTGGAYDIVPEMLIVREMMKSDSKIYPILFDEAGHRVALQYVLAALDKKIEADELLHYREYKHNLPGHPEMGVAGFSSGRLGHLWSYVNGIALANPDKTVVLFTSDGSFQEGNDAEAARFAVARNLNIKVFLDNNDVTIQGHPSEYMPGYVPKDTLVGHGFNVMECNGENLDLLKKTIHKATTTKGPVAILVKRKMAPGIKELEGSPKAHDAINVDIAINYLNEKGYYKAADMLRSVQSSGSKANVFSNREEFGKAVCNILKELSPEERNNNKVFDNDLAGSCGLHIIEAQFPEIFVKGGLMERSNFSAAAGFGSQKGRQGIYGTFSAFLEMLISEITMARMNNANVLAHFSHAGVDEISDNTSHFGINVLFANNGFADDKTRLYFPSDIHQMNAIVKEIFHDSGLRFIFSPRAATPEIKLNGTAIFKDQKFVKDKDELILDGKEGYIISYGDMLYRCLEVVEELRKQGHKIGLINKPTLNVVDEHTIRDIINSKFILLVESQNYKTGLGSIFGTWLLERGFKGKYSHIGVTQPGLGGCKEQIPHQGLDTESIKKTLLALVFQK